MTIIAVMVLLMLRIGFLPALAGMVIVVLTVPIQRKSAMIIGRLRRQMVSLTDSRVSLISEILQIIRAVKFYAWEDMLFARVSDIRALEVHKMWSYLVTSFTLRDVNQVSPVVTAAVIFTMLVFVVYRHSAGSEGGSNDQLSTTTTVTVLAYLNIVRFPLQLLGVTLKTLIDANVSVGRLNEFLTLEVLSTRDEFDDDKMNVENKPSIVFSNASFSWMTVENDNDKNCDQLTEADVKLNETYSPISVQAVSFPTTNNTHASITGLDFTVKQGELVALIGAVGSGKSNIISAILGEMPRVAGVCSVHGKVAYSAQTPWIQNMTVRENILFGCRIDRNNADITKSKSNSVSYDLYKQCLYQSALTTDLKNLPNGDATGNLFFCFDNVSSYYLVIHLSIVAL